MSARRAAPRKKGVIYFLGLGLSAGVLGLIVLLGLAVVGLPAIAGATPLTVLTRSMEPTYPPGTLVIVKPVEVTDLRIGDSLTYQIESGKPAVVTHRIIAISSSTSGSTTFMTKGDNNDVADPNPVVAEQIKGKVWYSVPFIGHVNSLIGGANKTWVVPVVAVALFLYAGWMFASGLAARSRKRRTSGRRAASVPNDS